MKRWLVLSIVSVSMAAAAEPARDTDVAAFQRELSDVFSPSGLTAEVAAARAARSAPVIARKTAAARAAQADLSKAKLSLLPVVGGKATYTRLSPLDSFVIPLGAQQLVIPFPDESYDVTAQVSVPVSDYLTRDIGLIGGASHALDAARLDQQAASAKVGQQARELYYEWLRARLQVLVARRQLAQVESTLAQVRALVEVQRASMADRLRVESQRAQARQAVDKLDSLVALREQQLRLLIDADDGEALTVGEDIRVEVDVPELGKLDALATQASQRRLEVRTVEAGIRAKEAQRRAETQALLPKLGVFAAVDYGKPNTRVFPSREDFQLTWAAGVQLTWVINESLVGHEVRSRLEAEADVLRADRVSLEHDIRVEVLAASQAVTLAQRAIETSQQGEKAAEEGYRVRKNLFAAGRSSIVEIVDAETELSRARIAALDARIDLRIALSRFAYATAAKR